LLALPLPEKQENIIKSFFYSTTLCPMFAESLNYRDVMDELRDEIAQYGNIQEKTDQPLLGWLAAHLTKQVAVVVGGGPASQIIRALRRGQPTLKIYAFDVLPLEGSGAAEEGIIYNKMDVLEWGQIEPLLRLYLGGDTAWREEVGLVYVDIHPHEGEEEKRIHDFLDEQDYTGLALYDDIWHFKSLRDNFWFQIPARMKYDYTEVGHFSGSGIVHYGGVATAPKWLRRRPSPATNWTLVTAYFDLTKCPDATDEIRARDPEYYFSHARGTMSVPYPLVVYCDLDSYARIEALRPDHLKSQTKYIICHFEEFRFPNNSRHHDNNFTDYRKKIQDNRVEHPYEFDRRNTPSYYLFCMSRYIMLKEVVEKNPYNSTHFAWINFCMERMGYENLVHLEEALSLNRDPFSTCYIDYIPASVIADTPTYFQRGRCSMCSGFFTGHASFMWKVCDLIIEKFLEYFILGYGHADEQLYSPVYFAHPHLFLQYYGDYQQMITNYRRIYENPQHILTCFAHNSMMSGEPLGKLHSRCALRMLWKGIKQGYIQLNMEQVRNLFVYLVFTLTENEENLIMNGVGVGVGVGDRA
jgi:hypothetical protein